MTDALANQSALRVAKTLGFAVPRRQPGSVGTMASRYRATAGGRPDQRGCLAYGKRGWPGNHPLCWSLGMRGALGMASQQGKGGFTHFFCCLCGERAGPAAGAGLLSRGGVNDRGAGPVDAAVPNAVAMNEY